MQSDSLIGACSLAIFLDTLTPPSQIAQVALTESEVLFVDWQCDRKQQPKATQLLTSHTTQERAHKANLFLPPKTGKRPLIASAGNAGARLFQLLCLPPDSSATDNTTHTGVSGAHRP
jgi:hypothetical protein